MASERFEDAARTLRGPLEAADAPVDVDGARAADTDLRWHTTVPEMKARFQQELLVLKRVWCPLALYLAMMLYGAAVLFRNIAFYRYRGMDWYADKVMPSKVVEPLAVSGAALVNVTSGKAVPLAEALRDGFAAGAGFNISIETPGLRSNLSALDGRLFNLKDFSEDYFFDFSDNDFVGSLNEIVAAVSVFLTIAILFLPFFVSFRGKVRPHIVAIIHRWQRTLFVVNMLRVPTYLATSVPGAAEHCQSQRWTSRAGNHGQWEVNQQHTLTVRDWFFDPYTFFNNCNCGDLIFSGHTGTALTNTLIVHYYARKMLSNGLANIVCTAIWTVFVVQIFCVLTTRNHYTVDVVVACYTAPLNFIANLYFFPKDVTPDGVPAEEEDDCSGRVQQGSGDALC